MFDKFHKVAKLDALLHDPELGMIIINSKETFGKFSTKFT